MKKTIPVLALVACLLFLASCAKPYFKSESFKKTTRDHQTIAVLPVKMVFKGSPLLKASERDRSEIEEAESEAFQISFMNQLLEHSTKKPLKVSLQSVSTTNKILRDQMTLRESWEKDPSELAEILGVDAVVRNEIEKKQFFDDLTSYGIQLGVKLISLFTKSVLPLIGGKNLHKSGDIYIRSSLMDGSDGTVLWTISQTKETDYSNAANEVIDNLNASVVKYFPYR